MIIKNTSVKPIGIGGATPIVIMPDEEMIVPDAVADTNGINTLKRMKLIECRPEPVPVKFKPEPDAEIPAQPADQPAQTPAKETTKKASAKRPGTSKSAE